ncbi:neprilysin-2-like [Ornithodoros turicata]|uniref:neprilysin-2-like n=1 Tax=Ornithodoros turicata TaxID=34597 RepID=UPI0031396F8F
MAGSRNAPTRPPTHDSGFFGPEAGFFAQEPPVWPMNGFYSQPRRVFPAPAFNRQLFRPSPELYARPPSGYCFAVPRYFQRSARLVVPSNRSLQGTYADPLQSVSQTHYSTDEQELDEVALSVPTEDNSQEPETEEATRWKDMGRRANTTQLTTGTTTSKLPPCTSEACQSEGRYLGGNLNSSVHPCDDFYSHVCSSNWYNGSTAGTYVSRASRVVLHSLWSYLKSEPVNMSSTSFLSQAAFLARGCMEGPKRDSEWAAFKTILSDLDIPGWPYYSDVPNINPHDVAKVADKLLGIATFVTLVLRQRSWDHELELHVDSPHIFLRRFEALQPRGNLTTYTEFVYKVLSLRRLASREIRDLAAEIVKLEEMMSEVAADSMRSVPVAHATRPLRSFKTVRNWDWFRYFSYFAEGTPSVPLTNVVVLDPVYLDQLTVILPEIHRRTLINYIGYRLAIYLSPLLPANKAHFILPITHPIALTKDASERLAACMFMLERVYPFGVRSITWSALMQKGQSPNLDDEELADDLKRLQDVSRFEIKQAALSAPWLNTNESRIASLKIERMEIELMPSKTDLTLPASTFSPSLPEQRELLTTYYKLLRFIRTQYWSGGDPTHFQARMSPSESVFRPGFSYDPQRNVITLSPATVVFGARLSRRIEAASVPFLLTALIRGMLSAIDIRGSTVDGDGAVRKWWSMSSQGAFLSRSWCIQGEFVESVKTYVKEPDESLFLYENVADNAVLRPLFNIFQKFAHRENRLVGVPGLPDGTTNQKLFFMDYASMFCEPTRSVVRKKMQLRYKISAPAKFRVNGPLKRFKPFAKVYECAEGTKMNPSRRCTFW